MVYVKNPKIYLRRRETLRFEDFLLPLLFEAFLAVFFFAALRFFIVVPIMWCIDRPRDGMCISLYTHAAHFIFDASVSHYCPCVWIDKSRQKILWITHASERVIEQSFITRTSGTISIPVSCFTLSCMERAKALTPRADALPSFTSTKGCLSNARTPSRLFPRKPRILSRIKARGIFTPPLSEN